MQSKVSVLFADNKNQYCVVLVDTVKVNTSAQVIHCVNMCKRK